MRWSIIPFVLLVFGDACACERTSSTRPDAAPPPPPAPIDAAPPLAVPPPPPPPPPPVGPLMTVYRGAIVLRDQAPRGRGPARLVLGEVPVTDDAADHDRFVASRAVDLGKLRAQDRAWIGQDVLIGGGGVMCLGKVGEPRAYAEVVGLGGETFDLADDLAEAVMEQGRRFLAAEVDAPCADGASWSIPAASQKPVVWTYDGASVRHPGGGLTSLDVDVTGGGCPDTTAYRIAHGGRVLARARKPFTLRDVIDFDHDGWPELMLDDGWMATSDAGKTYARVVAFRHTYDWYLCIE